MEIALLKTSIIVSVLFFIDKLILKAHRAWMFYFVGFIVVFLLQFFWPSKAQAYEFVPNAAIEQAALDKKSFELLTAGQKSYYIEKIKKYRHDAEWCLSEARAKCFYLPSNHDREYARGAITTALMALATKEPRAAIIAGLITMLTDYFTDMVYEWNEIQNKLNWAQYYTEMADYYQSILDNPEA